jgi:alkylresorcinol/alkylpyrone synthase
MFLSKPVVSFPDTQIGEKETYDFLKKSFPEYDSQRISSFIKNSKIKNRNMCRSLDWLAKYDGIDDRQKEVEKHAKDLSLQSAKECMKVNGVDPKEIECIISVTSTVNIFPTISYTIQNELNLNDNCRHIPLMGLGCNAGVAAIRMAMQESSHNKGTVLILTIEMSSLMYRKNENSTAGIVNNILFADGASTTLVRWKEFKSGICFRLYNSPENYFSYTIPNSANYALCNFDSRGVTFRMDRKILKAVEEVSPYVKEFLKSFDLQKCSVVCHAGGTKILSEVENMLELKTEHLSTSYDTMKNSGNVVSTTLFDSIRREFEKCEKSKVFNRSILISLGPGFGINILVGRFVTKK